jgi:hypothetical protein
MEAHTGTKFQTARSDDIAGPDLPMGKYLGRKFYDGENTKRGPALFFVDREAGTIYFENCRIVLFSGILKHVTRSFLEILKQRDGSFFGIASS